MASRRGRGYLVLASILLSRPIRHGFGATFALLACLAAAGSAESEFPDASAADRLLSEISRSPSIEENLRVICDELGGRMPGSPAMDRAVEWALEAFRRAGVDHVHSETFSMPSSWREGAVRIEVSEPIAFPRSRRFIRLVARYPRPRESKPR